MPSSEAWMFRAQKQSLRRSERSWASTFDDFSYSVRDKAAAAIAARLEAVIILQKHAYPHAPMDAASGVWTGRNSFVVDAVPLANPTIESARQHVRELCSALASTVSYGRGRYRPSLAGRWRSIVSRASRKRATALAQLPHAIARILDHHERPGRIAKK